MKKRLLAVLLVLVLVLALSLTACESKEVKAVREAIDAIGTVTADSGAAIENARALYDALPAEEQEKVNNYAALQNAEFDLAMMGFEGYVEETTAVLEEMYSWIDTAWTNAEVTWTSLKSSVTGEEMDVFLSNAEYFIYTNSYDAIAELVGEDAANWVKLQNYAMHIGAAAPAYFEDVLLSDLEAAGAYGKNTRMYELKEQRLSAALGVTLYEGDIETFAAALPEKAAVAQRLLDAVLAYSGAVFDDLATYATEADWQTACEAAKTELDAAMSAYQG